MDVRCERCGTEYEFEDERVTEEGVTVKCSTCGHLFKIRRKSFVLTEPVLLGKKEEEDGGRNWMVRKTDGTVLSFKELTTLQKWIVERKVTRADEISRTGENWKQLGTIAELASFFQVVDQAQAAQAAPVTAPQMPAASTTQPLPAALPQAGAPVTQPLPAAVTPAPGVPAPPAVPPLGATPVPGQPQVVPAAATAPGQTQSPAPESAAPPAEPAVQPPAPAAPASEPELPAEQQFLQAGYQAPEPDSWGDGAVAEDDDVIEKWKRRSRRKWYFLVPLFLVIAGIGAWYLVHPESFKQVLEKITGGGRTIAPEAAQAYQQAARTLLGDTEADFGAAARLLEQAIKKMDGQYPEALALLAVLHTERADRGQQDILALDSRIAELQKQEDALKPADGSEPKGELFDKIAALHNQKVDLQKQRVKLVDQARQALDEAKRLADDARRLDPKSVLAAVALADYYRVKGGERTHVEKVLAPVRAQAAGNPWFLYVDGASLAADAEQAAAAEALLRQALSRESGLLAARLQLARLLLAQQKAEAARAELQAILASRSGHPQAKRLLAELGEPQPPAAEAKPDGGQPAAAAAPSYEELIKQAARLLDRGATRKALAAYDQVLKLRPGDAAALAGKGLCYLDAGSNAAAIAWFSKALKANPRNADALMGLAEAHKYQGNTAQARKFYQRYLEYYPSGPEASVARRNLKDLQ